MMKLSGVKYCKVVHRRPWQEISQFGELCSLRSPKSDQSAARYIFALGCHGAGDAGVRMDHA